MSELWRDPRYIALASIAASRLGAANDAAVSGILALWECEQPSPAPWPPIHNNPGNLTRHVGDLDGEPHGIATRPPGAGLLYTYDGPQAGARAFANYLLRSSRYHGAIAAARAGNAHAMVHAITSAGYGTNGRCASNVLDRIHASVHQPEHHRYTVTARVLRVRHAPHVGALVVGHHRKGDHVYGSPVSGGPYPVNGHARHAWLRLGDHMFVAAAYCRRLS